MTREIVPAGFREPFDPLAEIDHQHIAEYTKIRLSDNPGAALNTALRHNQTMHYPLVVRLATARDRIEPVDEDLNPIDVSLQRSRDFDTGFALAVLALDIYSIEARLACNKWRNIWEAKDEDFELGGLSPESIKTGEERHKAGERWIALGNWAYERLEPDY